MDISQEILSNITVYMKYAKYLPEKQRRETWEELVTRNKEMHQRKFPDLTEEIEHVYKLVYEKKVLPSMRCLQFSEKPIEINPVRAYNCSYTAVDHPKVFSEIMFLLLCGTGVGYSVQKHHVAKLPVIRKPQPDRAYGTRRFLVPDSIEGWADAIDMLIQSFFKGGPDIVFDFRDIRPKGTLLKTSGGKAPGPEPLKICLRQIKSILNEKRDGDQLLPIEVHDIMCHLADAVLAGGVRRSAMISLFSIDDEDMISCKSGSWWENNPQRGRANNSAVIVRHMIDENTFLKLWKRIEASGAGEPGLFFTHDPEIGTNPCCEISLNSQQFCNLTEINGGIIESQEKLEQAARAAAFIGTLQASYTDFHYLRPGWKRQTEKEALLGIGITGIGAGKVQKLNLEEAANIAVEENKRIAELIGINPAARVTTIKPSGTSSLVLGTSSGIHAYHSPFYLRRIRVGKNEDIYYYLYVNHTELVEDEFFKPHQQAVITIPQKAPKEAIFRTESALDLLERVKDFHIRWVKPGHVSGVNSHNVSATVSIKPDEWDEVGKWMWENRNHYNGLSVLPYSDHTYKQAPFEECDEETYERLFKSLQNVDLTKIVEMGDNTNLSGEAACAGGNCEIV